MAAGASLPQPRKMCRHADPACPAEPPRCDWAVRYHACARCRLGQHPATAGTDRPGTASLKERLLSRSSRRRRVLGFPAEGRASDGGLLVADARHQGVGVNVERPQGRSGRGRTTLTPATAGARWRGSPVNRGWVGHAVTSPGPREWAGHDRAEPVYQASLRPRRWGCAWCVAVTARRAQSHSRPRQRCGGHAVPRARVLAVSVPAHPVLARARERISPSRRP